MPPLTGRVIAGRYNLQTPIGRGAMGVVWRAHDQLLDREVAVKEVVISALIGADERHNAYQRTLREAKTAARLSHRGIVAIYDVVQEDGRPWIIMELVPSQSLDQVLVIESRLPAARVCQIGQQLLSALAAAHLAGVLHRDVKPSNVLIAASRTGEGWDERAVLTDFGIAQFEGDPRLTQTGMVMGSPGFTAPERIRGSDATPASDLWSLGATLYAAVEGRGPYENRGGAITTMSAIINEDAPVAPHAGHLAPVIAGLLRRDPFARPSAATAARMFAQALTKLSEAREEPPPMAHPPTMRSAYVLPQAPSVSVTAADSARPEGKAAPAAKEEPVKQEPVKQEPAGDQPAGEEPAGEAPAAPGQQEQAEAPPADEAAEAAGAGEADDADDAVVEAAAAAADAADAHADAAESDIEPEAESVSAAAAIAEAEPDAAERPAAETAVFHASSVPESAAIPVPPPADQPTAPSGPAIAQQAAAAALVAAESGDGEPGSLAAETVTDRNGEDTVLPGKAGAGYQPTEVALPSARSAPPPSIAQPKPAEPKPVPPKPTFTAAKPGERAAPSFSAASPVRPAPQGRPTPPRSASVSPPSSSERPGYGQGNAARGYQPPSLGSTTPYPPSGAQYRPPGGQGGQLGHGAPGAQYAGPVQAAPDLSRHYPPGAGGGYPKPGRQGPGRKILWGVVAVAIAAAIGIGTALALNHDNTSGNGNHGGSTGSTQPAAVPSVEDTKTGFLSIDALNTPSTALPGPAWTTQTVTRAQAGSTAAGFSIDVPPGWTEKQSGNGLATEFSGPGNKLLEVDLTQQSTTDMLAAATQVRNASVSKFPGYVQKSLEAEPVRHTQGAVWKFAWTPPGQQQNTVDDIFFAQATSGGVQDYTIYIRSPTSTFGTEGLPIFDKMLATFQTVPAS
jgi:hypothetical protein